MRIRKILISACAIIVAGAAIWIGRFPALYYYFLWRLNHTPEDAVTYNPVEGLDESVIVNLYGSIQIISPYVVPLLIHTYENANASERSRIAAAVGLMSADRDRAKKLFHENNDEEIYAALYQNYLWQMNHTTEGSLLIDLHEDIQTIAPHIVPLLVRTYEDVKEPSKSRNAAGLALLKEDRQKAEELFLRFLDNEDEEVKRIAIWNLGSAKSDKPFNTILDLAYYPDERIREAVRWYLENLSDGDAISHLIPAEGEQRSERLKSFAHHPNAKIRMALVDYLGDLNDSESISLLKEMEASDPDQRVRGYAGYRLQRVGALPDRIE